MRCQAGRSARMVRGMPILRLAGFPMKTRLLWSRLARRYGGPIQPGKPAGEQFHAPIEFSA
ncbi:hypothetical protein RISK_004820 [Rhodopirellula islandica]|uniref:Uncharacterized protein n=1 Tax=Rhodopirellula islandica TaxID=595434 RepID=A0A0J1EBX1_RHOIS|nr:hypothetical protein RISK_004820 [Rhodopirellula islandica]